MRKTRLSPNPILLISIAVGLIPNTILPAQTPPLPYPWPEGKEAALSLSFDDARLSQVDVGAGLFDRFGVKVTFYVSPAEVNRRLAGWKRITADGHEIGNHTVNHPCTGNFSWSRESALENYTLPRIRSELVEASNRIEKTLGVRPTTFAYPCGQTFVGRGLETKSYVPVVAELFEAGRGWLGETTNDPWFCDLAQVLSMAMDETDFEEVRSILDKARETGQWLILTGHEIGDAGFQTTRVAMLEKLIPYALDPARAVWIAPVGTVAKHILHQRHADARNRPGGKAAP